jgi:hypothetical protein
MGRCRVDCKQQEQQQWQQQAEDSTSSARQLHSKGCSRDACLQMLQETSYISLIAGVAKQAPLQMLM